MSGDVAVVVVVAADRAERACGEALTSVAGAVSVRALGRTAATDGVDNFCGLRIDYRIFACGHCLRGGKAWGSAA